MSKRFLGKQLTHAEEKPLGRVVNHGNKRQKTGTPLNSNMAYPVGRKNAIAKPGRE